MNLKLLRGCLLEELGRLSHTTRGLGELLSKTEHAIGLPGLRVALAEMARSEANQEREFHRLFVRFEAVAPEKPSPAVAGLFVEMQEDLHRQSGVYPPTAMDFRLLAGLNKIVHYKLATLRSAIIAARLLEAREIESELERCLEQEYQKAKCLSEFADDLLRHCGAESREEIAEAITSR
jgi:ferritin-like metal-binding protein YciE